MNDIDNLQDYLDEVNYNVEAYINKNFCHVPASDINLDVRVGRVWVHPDERMVAVERGHSQRMIEYYGGFEYIEDEFKMTIGNWVIYKSENEDGDICYRVDELFEEDEDGEFDIILGERDEEGKTIELTFEPKQ